MEVTLLRFGRDDGGWKRVRASRGSYAPFVTACPGDRSGTRLRDSHPVHSVLRMTSRERFGYHLNVDMSGTADDVDPAEGERLTGCDHGGAFEHRLSDDGIIV